MGRAAKRKVTARAVIKLDLGCGPHARDGFTGLDRLAFDGVAVWDLRQTPWRLRGKVLAEGSVDEAHCSHFLEHLTATERVLFMNELYRVLKPGGTCLIVVPHWASARAYGDPTHQWPPVSEFAILYWQRQWRLANAPHTDEAHADPGFACDFDATYGYNLRGDLGVRNIEYQQFAVGNYKEACQDTLITVTKMVR